MCIAIAAGAAGAIATVNKRVSSSIAGVAIAVALVAPLAVVGVTLGGGRFADAGGAFLLLLTNFAAIVLSAALVFVLTGFAEHRRLQENPMRVLGVLGPFVALRGSGEPPSAEELKADLDAELGGQSALRLTVTPVEVTVVPAR